MKINDIARRGFLFAPPGSLAEAGGDPPAEPPAADDEGLEAPDPAAPPEGEPAPAAEPPAQPSEEEIGRRWAQQNGYTFAQQRPSDPPAAPAPLPSPFAQAQADAEAQGIMSDAWIYERALTIQQERTDVRLAQIETQARVPVYEREFERDGLPKEAAAYMADTIPAARVLSRDPAQQDGIARALAVGIAVIQGAGQAAAKPQTRRVTMPTADDGAPPRAQAGRLTQTEQTIADSLARTYYGVGKATPEMIALFKKDGDLD